LFNQLNGATNRDAWLLISAEEWSTGATLMAPSETWRNHHQEIHHGYLRRRLKGTARQTLDEMTSMSAAQKKASEQTFASADTKKWMTSPHGQAVL
jgi:hypothetical protein